VRGVRRGIEELAASPRNRRTRSMPVENEWLAE
jgi:hypothetical protein